MSKKQILILSSRFPYPLEKGDKLRLYHQMNALKEAYDISLIAITQSSPSEKDMIEMEKLCSDIYVFKLGMIARIWNMVIGIFLKRPFQVSYFYSKTIHRKIEIIIKETQPDIIYSQLVRTAEYVKAQPIKKVVDFMDAFAWGMNKRSESTGPFYSLLYRLESYFLDHYEQHIFDRFDYHTIISEQDRDRMNITMRDKIKIVPNGVDTTFFSSNSKKEIKHQICFIGNMGYLPNIKAVEYIAKKIVPSLAEQHDEFKLVIAGARPVQSVKNLANKNIEVSGWIADIRDAYNDAYIFVAPIFIGIGQQNKILEAMAMGVPCITTTVVNNSIGAIPGESILIADTAEEYITTINFLIDNQEQYNSIRKHAKLFVRKNFSWKSQSKELFDIFAQ